MQNEPIRHFLDLCDATSQTEQIKIDEAYRTGSCCSGRTFSLGKAICNLHEPKEYTAVGLHTENVDFQILYDLNAYACR